MELEFLVDPDPDREKIRARVSLVSPLNLPNEKVKFLMALKIFLKTN